MVPPTLQSEILKWLHSACQEITKTREQAKMSVCWPSISQQIIEMVNLCLERSKTRYQHPEPLIPSEHSQLPWQHVASDLFERKNSTMMIIIHCLVLVCLTYISDFFTLLCFGFANQLNI